MSNFVAKNSKKFFLLWGGIFLVLTEGASLRFDQMLDIGCCTRVFLGWPANCFVHVRKHREKKGGLLKEPIGFGVRIRVKHEGGGALILKSPTRMMSWRAYIFLKVCSKRSANST